MRGRGILVFLLVATSSTALASPAAELVGKLVAHPPARLSELEAIIGPIHMSFDAKDDDDLGMIVRPRPRSGEHEFTRLVPSLVVQYAFDMYHEDPTRPRDVELTELSLEIRGDPAEAERILRDHFGNPRTVTEKVHGTPVARYAAFHPFYLARDPGVTDRFRLEWYAEVPRWAIPEPDPKARLAWLRQLQHRIATAHSIDEIDAFCRAAPPAAGIQITGTLDVKANPYGRPAKDGRDYGIDFVPPVRAEQLADVFGWSPAVGVSHDVHRSSWHLERRDGDWLPISGADSQWEIAAYLTEGPSGAVVPKGKRHDSGLELGDEDEVGHLVVEPRFK